MRGLRQPREDSLGEEAGILGEQAEQDPVEEVSDRVRLVSSRPETLSDLREVSRRRLRDLLRDHTGPELLRGGESGAKNGEGGRRVGRSEVAEGDPVQLRTQPGEVRPDLDR